MRIEDFEKKKILIFCPHEDDEINLAGGLLLKLKKIECDIKVIYSTNGDYFIDAKYRIREAIKSLKKLGVPKDKVIFLGYPDCFSEYESHLYMSDGDCISPKGKTETYLPNGEEYHYQKHGEHATLNRENFIGDIFEILEEEMADILICVDYDEHADHRALSLAFEHAMGKMLNLYCDYSPIVLKAFAYPTEFLGIDDFKNHNLLETKFERNKISLYEYYNPYYNWNNRVCVDVSSCVKNKFLLFNPLFTAMTKHVSQSIYNRAYRIINRDQVFFRRRTDNLLYHSDVETSSGDAEQLRDFMRFDSSNIMKGDTKPEVIDLGYMKFDEADKEKKIQISFDEEVDIEEINLYQYVNCKTKLTQIKLIVDDKQLFYNVEKKDYSYNLCNLNLKQVQKLDIMFENCKNLALTELEIFSNQIVGEVIPEEKQVKNTIFDKIIFMLDDCVIFSYKCLFKILRDLFMR